LTNRNPPCINLLKKNGSCATALRQRQPDDPTIPRASPPARTRPNWSEGKHTKAARAAVAASMLPTPASTRGPRTHSWMAGRNVAHNDNETVRNPQGPDTAKQGRRTPATAQDGQHAAQPTPSTPAARRQHTREATMGKARV
jgi:hypothetical protein